MSDFSTDSKCTRRDLCNEESKSKIYRRIFLDIRETPDFDRLMQLQLHDVNVDEAVASPRLDEKQAGVASRRDVVTAYISGAHSVCISSM
jgi:hypothetical protein